VKYLAFLGFLILVSCTPHHYEHNGVKCYSATFPECGAHLSDCEDGKEYICVHDVIKLEDVKPRQTNK